MDRAGKPSVRAMLEGVSMGHEIDHGLGFLDPDWFVDQHILVRGRFARTLVAMNEAGIHYGVGVDEDTALVVQGNTARVIGYRGVIVLDLSDAAADETIQGFNLKNIKLTYLDRGDSIHLRSLEVTPAAEKADDRKIEPFSPGFHPTFKQRIFCNDILGNTSLLDVMCMLLDNKHDDAIGLAFDGNAARHGKTPGFEFRFYRETDTLGWETESFGGDDYTVVNIHLDIRPITIKGPLYE